MKILIIDDNKDYTDTLKDVLESNNYEVCTLNYSHLAYKYINDFKPDVVLTDLKMQTSGFDIAWSISQSYPEIQVYGVTNYYDLKKEHWLAKECNLKDIFNKQNPEELVKQLKEIECLLKK